MQRTTPLPVRWARPTHTSAKLPCCHIYSGGSSSSFEPLKVNATCHRNDEYEWWEIPYVTLHGECQRMSLYWSIVFLSSPGHDRMVNCSNSCDRLKGRPVRRMSVEMIPKCATYSWNWAAWSPSVAKKFMCQPSCPNPTHGSRYP